MPNHSKATKMKKPPIDISDDENPTEIRLTPPQEYYDAIPSTDLTIHNFLTKRMPRLRYDKDEDSLDPSTAKASIASRQPRYTMDDVFTVDIPPVKWIDSLLEALKARFMSSNAKQKKNISVIHPFNTTVVFPAWIAKAWFHLRSIAEDWHQWRKMVQWLTYRTPSAQTLAVNDIISQAVWGTDVPILCKAYPESRISRLAVFTSSEWVTS